MTSYDVVIIGSGPAGLTSAIYSARDGFKTLVIEGHQPGGQLTITSDVENFPGFPDGISGIELMERMKRQADKFGVKFIQRDVTAVNIKSKPYKIITIGDELQTKALIIATGSGPRWIGIDAEKKLIGKGVSACATCDAFFFRGKDVVVVGGGDTAAEEALYLTKFAKKVTLIHRRSELRAAPIMSKRLEDDPKVDFSWNSVVVDIKDVASDSVTGVIIKDVNTNEEKLIKCEGVFVAIGHIPNTAIFKDQIDMDDKGYIIVNNSKTNVEGIFAAGDCADTKYWQAITAAGSGCVAARELREFLSNNPS